MSNEERYASPLDIPPGRIVRGVDESISVGNILWVLVDPHRGHEFAYNRWYERDHFYAGAMVGAGVYAGSRWVATRAHKAARFPADSDWPFDLKAGSYACVYFVSDAHTERWRPWSSSEAQALYATGRGFQSRTHYNTGYYEHEWRAYRDGDPVPLELALDHRYAGLVAQFVSPLDGGMEALDGWFDQELPGWLAGSSVASVSSWRVHPDNPPARPGPATVGPDDRRMPYIPGDSRASERRLHLLFLDEEPLRSWDHHRELARRLADSGVGRVDVAMPFVPTVVGTDRYVDELW